MMYSVSMNATAPMWIGSSYIKTVDKPYSCDATYENFNNMLNELMTNYNKKSIKQEILEMYGECIYFSKDENTKLKEYIHSNSIEEKNNIFDYYD